MKTNTRKFTSKGIGYTAEITHDSDKHTQECAENYTIWNLQIQARGGNLKPYANNEKVIKCDVYGRTYKSTDDIVADMSTEQRDAFAKAIKEAIKLEKAA